MKENIQHFKKWWNVAKPSKKYLFLAFITALIPQICLTIEPIFAARVITSISTGFYIETMIYLIIVFVLIKIIRFVSWHFNFMIFPKLLGSSYVPLQKRILDKIKNAEEFNFEKHSKEKLINIINSSSVTVGKFADLLATRCARLLRGIVLIFTIFSINIPSAIIVLIVSIINFFIVNNIDKRRAKIEKEKMEINDLQYTKFSEFVDVRNFSDDLNITDKLEQEYLQVSKDYIDAQRRHDIANSMKDNFYEIYYSFILLILTLAMVFLVSKGSLDLTLYFMIVSYMTSAIEMFNNFFDINNEMKTAVVASNRINIILNFKEKRSINVGSLDQDDIMGNIKFMNVTYNGNKENPKLENVNFKVKVNEIALFIGQRNSGKRSIFHLLTREIKQDEGNVYLDGIDIFDYSKKVHKTNINYLVTKPYFFNDSIGKNLKMVEPDMKKIIKVLATLNLVDYINSLPKKLNTKINDLSEGKKYLIQLARTLLMNSEVIILYEFPNSLSSKEKENILIALNILKDKKTIIIFSATDYAASIADKVYEVKKGIVTKIKHKTK